MIGRVGDTPIIGCGTYCDNRVGGISSTGHGDILMRACLAHDVIKRMEYLKEPIQVACESSCRKMLRDLKGTGGVIGLSKDGDIGIAFTSNRMAWSYQRGNELHYGIQRNDDFVKEVSVSNFFSDDEEE